MKQGLVIKGKVWHLLLIKATLEHLSISLRFFLSLSVAFNVFSEQESCARKLLHSLTHSGVFTEKHRISHGSSPNRFEETRWLYFKYLHSKHYVKKEVVIGIPNLDAILVYLQCYEVCARDHHNHKDSSNSTLDEYHRQQSDSHESSHSTKSGRMGRIEASIIPIVNSKGSGHDKESSSGALSKAEVRVLVPKDSGPLRNSLIRPPDPHEEGLIRASSILMEYDEDTRKYMQPDARTPIPEHRIRHSSHKHIAPEPLLDDYFAANDAPLDEVDSSPSSSTPTEDQQSKTNDEDLRSSDSRDNPTSIFLRVNSFSPAPRRLYPSSKAQREEALGNTIQKAIASSRTFKPLGQDSVIAFHSPVRIYIPVRYDAESSSSPAQDTDDNCVQCPQNFTLTAPRGETRAETPVPAISVCHRYFILLHSFIFFLP
ncbi:hypothetical protein AVEN_30258-1 [Araneus ventricosus]|uniref:Uncharacterized protein n=1 Tax=Araneus ventricosus TaxID=182803 RepID=A0A4Y2PMS4_ARAVE|nr:hypothetical protein AVEN_30258-1 [Araneus ventricosus]